MRISNQPVSPMYLWAIALLSFMVVVSSYTLHAFPLSLILAFVLAGFIEMVMRKCYLKLQFKIPFSGLITGLIIGCVAPINAPPLLILIAVVVAIASKFLIKYRGSNIFNPASIGLVAALAIFNLGDEWWAANSYNIYGVAVSITPLLIILAYEARRLTTAASFIAVSLVLAVALGDLQTPSIANVLTLLFSLNYYFAFVMLIEPKTSPNERYAQAGYGAAVALLYWASASLRIAHPLLVTLLIGNLLYLIYRKYGKR